MLLDASTQLDGCGHDRQPVEIVHDILEQGQALCMVSVGRVRHETSMSWSPACNAPTQSSRKSPRAAAIAGLLFGFVAAIVVQRSSSHLTLVRAASKVFDSLRPISSHFVALSRSTHRTHSPPPDTKDLNFDTPQTVDRWNGKFIREGCSSRNVVGAGGPSIHHL